MVANEFLSTRRNLTISMLASHMMLYVDQSFANELRRVSLSPDEINRSILSLLSSKRRYGENLQSLLLNGARLELWDLKNSTVYFSIPDSVVLNAEVFSGFAKNWRDRLDATVVNNSLRLDGFMLTRTKQKYNLFSLRMDNIYFPADRKISIEFEYYKFQTTLESIALLIKNSGIYGGKLRVSRVPDGLDRPAFLNHGALVAYSGDVFLGDLVKQIVDGDQDVSARTQSLLNFVTRFIRYDEREFYFGREFLQRYTETLVAREGDCSNKVILFASMLEQLDTPYLLAYSKNHIFVAVEEGTFSNLNGYGFKFGGKTWTPAETTAAGFIIGKTKVTRSEFLTEIRYIQEPRNRNVLKRFEDGFEILFN